MNAIQKATIEEIVERARRLRAIPAGTGRPNAAYWVVPVRLWLK